MKIDGRVYVAIDYSLKLDSGEEVDRSEPGKPLGFIFGASQIVPGLEKKLTGLEVGQRVELAVPPEEGYGAVRPDLLRELPRSQFPQDAPLKEGMVFQATSPHGPMNFRIKSVKDDVISCDFNHPLAGEQLNFDVTVREVRDPTPEEIDALNSSSCGPSACQSCTCTSECEEG
ncbi:MAG: peptidylprolyl isomerase [Myxococcota bacterium]|nr:peptidylprolyl isomerase [Myxococcota bacterium]